MNTSLDAICPKILICGVLTLQVLDLPAHGPRGGGGGVPPDPHRVGPGGVEDDEVHGDDGEVGQEQQQDGQADVESRGGGWWRLTVEGGEERGDCGGETEEGEEEGQGPDRQTEPQQAAVVHYAVVVEGGHDGQELVQGDHQAAQQHQG